MTSEVSLGFAIDGKPGFHLPSLLQFRLVYGLEQYKYTNNLHLDLCNKPPSARIDHAATLQ